MTILVVLALVVMYNWSLKQLDVTNAFLHGFLHEKVLMKILPSYQVSAKIK